MKLTYKYKTATKYATNLLMGVLCAYSVCACGGAQNITPHNPQSDNERPDNNQYEDPTEQNEHDNNHDINDNQWEQPDENHPETPDEQNTPDNQWEQPDENHPETPDEQNTPDNQWEQGDEDHQDVPDEQNDQDNNEIPDNEGKCDPGYVWADYDIDPWLNDPEIGINDGKDYDNQCAPCISINRVVETGFYCPGGYISDLKNKSIKFQVERCPSKETPKNDLSGCYCPYGVPPPGKTCSDLYHGTRKPLIINPKVNVIRRNNLGTQLLLRNSKMNKR